MEPGLVPVGTIDFSLTTLYGSDFQGSHPSRRGTLSGGRGVAVPLYRHDVSLDYGRAELALKYTVAPGWAVIGRLPWEAKAQRAAAVPIDPPTPDEVEAMRRNVDLHHRSVSLRGLGDLMLLGQRSWSSVWRHGDAVNVSGGVTLPTGRTVENPYRLGDQGRQHLHIQFGTGTIDPLIESNYSTPLTDLFSAGAYLSGRFSLYENTRAFKAAPEMTAGVYLARRLSERVQLRIEGALYRQGYGYWEGLRDENTGLLASSLSAGATMRLRRATVSVDLRWPLSQRTLAEGDAFEQGPTVIFSVGGVLRRPPH